MRQRQVVDDHALVVGERQRLGRQRRRGRVGRRAGRAPCRRRLVARLGVGGGATVAGRGVIRHSRCGWPGRAARAGTARPSTAVTMPTGSSVGANSAAGDEVGGRQQRGADRRAGQEGGAAAPHQAAGDLRRHQGDEADGPRARHGDGRQRDADEQQARAHPLDPGAETRRRRRRRGRACAGAARGRGRRAVSRASAQPSGRTWSQPRPLRLPVSHTIARWAS